MKHIIHDRGDEDRLRILRNCMAAMPDRAKLLVCEKVIAPGNEVSKRHEDYGSGDARPDRRGRERTETAFKDLFARAGFRLARILPTKVDNSIVELTE